MQRMRIEALDKVATAGLDFGRKDDRGDLAPSCLPGFQASRWRLTVVYEPPVRSWTSFRLGSFPAATSAFAAAKTASSVATGFTMPRSP